MLVCSRRLSVAQRVPLAFRSWLSQKIAAFSWPESATGDSRPASPYANDSRLLRDGAPKNIAGAASVARSQCIMDIPYCPSQTTLSKPWPQCGGQADAARLGIFQWSSKIKMVINRQFLHVHKITWLCSLPYDQQQQQQQQLYAGHGHSQQNTCSLLHFLLTHWSPLNVSVMSGRVLEEA